MDFIHQLLYRAWYPYCDINSVNLPNKIRVITSFNGFPTTEFQINLSRDNFVVTTDTGFKKEYDTSKLFLDLFYWQDDYQQIVQMEERAKNRLLHHIMRDYTKWIIIKEKERAYKGTECYTNE